MAYNKVTYKGEVIMDITDSTVTPETLGEGVIAYGANGERIVGLNDDITVASDAIIDVINELPTEGINEKCFYRVLTAKFVTSTGTENQTWTCRCVESLPEVGEVCTDDYMSFINVYYNLADNEAYGYLDDETGANIGVPAGWYTVGMLWTAIGGTWGGIITDINDMSEYGEEVYILLSYDLYTHKDEWVKMVFAYEKVPKFDFRWNGIIGDRFSLDMSQLGYENAYFVKINDEVLTIEDCIGSTFYSVSGAEELISSGMIDTDSFPGALSVNDCVVVVYSSADLNSALGLPVGYITNGIYFLYNPPVIEGDTLGSPYFITRLVAPSKIAKIDAKYLDESSLLDIANNTCAIALQNYYTKFEVDWRIAQYAKTSDVYTKYEVDTKIANAVIDNVDLSNYVQHTELTQELSNYAKTTDIETMINNAIGSAIGGSY